MKNRWLLAGAAGALVFSAMGCVDRQSQKEAKQTEAFILDKAKSVETKPVATSRLDKTIEVTGEVTTSDDTTVGVKTAGRLVAVYVKDGDNVTAGQLIARQDTTQLAAQVNQAIASLNSAQSSYQSAQSQLALAIRNASVNPSKTSSAIRSAEAQLRSAKAQLQKATTGARPEDRAQAQANVTSAKSNLDTQKSELERIKTLVNEGALAGNRLDQQQTAYQQALAQYKVAVEALKIQKNLTRPEDILVAQEAVKQAQEQLATARSNKELDQTYTDQVNSARAQVASAKAQIQNAQAQVVIAQQALRDADVLAPFSGKIAGKPTQVGTSLGGGGTVARIIGQQGVYFEGSVPSDVVDQISNGMSVSVSVGSLAGKEIQGKVVAVSPVGSSVARLFTVRIQLLGASSDVRPGMYARGRIVLKTIPDAVMIPNAAIVDRSGKKVVFLNVNGKAKMQEVSLGISREADVQVQGIQPGAQLVIQGQSSLADGDTLKIAKPGDPSAPKESKA